MSDFVIVKLTYLVAIFVVYVMGAYKYSGNLPPSGPRRDKQWQHWPWQVQMFPKLAISMAEGFYKLDVCSGALVDHRWVITSMACVDNLVVAVMRLGVSILSKPNLVFMVVERSSTIPETVFDNGHIGLIALDRHVEYTPLLNSIRIQSSKDAKKDYKDVPVYSSGFGMSHNLTEKPKSEQLVIVKLRVVNTEECASLYSDKGSTQKSIADRVICVAGFDKKSDICMIDDGSPLVTEDQNGVYTLIGVSDFGSSCDCDVDTRRGFTRAGIYHEWLHKVTKLNLDGKGQHSTKMIAPQSPTARTPHPPERLAGERKEIISESTAESEDDLVDFVI